ncbi:MAG: stage II sporulation protein R [Clostridia bacterium]|nr:stage II sporulation protein R [Clostridia bacterium]
MKKTVRKNVEFALAFGLVCAIVLSFAGVEARCDELRRGVLRLHILANSDSDADQQLKLKVRDRILELTASDFGGSNNINEAIKTASDNIETITAAASEVIKEEGFSYGVSAFVGKEFFGNREYEDFTLPAGVYNSLTVRIGEAKGHNWWCVLFPGICLPAAKKSGLEKAVSNKSAALAKGGSKYKICFKTVEIFERFKNKFRKK